MLHAGNWEGRTRRIVGQAVSLAWRSIVVGSAITGAPGQPVDTGALKASWMIEWAGSWVATITSTLIYAALIEAGIGRFGPLTLRSRVGGFHSLALTAAGWQRLVDAAARDTLASELAA